MTAASPVVLNHTWPLHERARHFDLGLILNCAAIDLVAPPRIGGLSAHHAACWECNLADDTLLWSGGVYDIFGLPRGSKVTREEAVAFYCEDSRAKMERLRAYAIRHRCGFTLDAEIRTVGGERRRMRLIAAPICQREQPVLLHGLKLII